MGIDIDEILETTGLNQIELAMALGVTPSAVSMWVSGKRHPQPVFAERLARSLRVIDGHQVRGVFIPNEPWEAPAFNPPGPYRLPLRLSVSDSVAARTRDGTNEAHQVSTATAVLMHGTLDDVARWIDLGWLHDHLDELPLWPEAVGPWREFLRYTGPADLSARSGGVHDAQPDVSKVWSGILPSHWRCG